MNHLSNMQEKYLNNNGLRSVNTFIDINETLYDKVSKLRRTNSLTSLNTITSDTTFTYDVKMYNYHITNSLISSILEQIKFELIIKKLYEPMVPRIIIWKELITEYIKTEYSNHKEKNKQQQVIKCKLKQIDNTISTFILNMAEKIKIFVKSNIKILKKCKKLLIPIDEIIKLNYKDYELQITHNFKHCINMSDFQLFDITNKI